MGFGESLAEAIAGIARGVRVTKDIQREVPGVDPAGNPTRGTMQSFNPFASLGPSISRGGTNLSFVGPGQEKQYNAIAGAVAGEQMKDMFGGGISELLQQLLAQKRMLQIEALEKKKKGGDSNNNTKKKKRKSMLDPK